jgi:hypothetical protein
VLPVSFPWETFLNELESYKVSASVPLLLHEPEVYIYGPTGLSCGVGAEFPKLQFLFHLLPVSPTDRLSSALSVVINVT